MSIFKVNSDAFCALDEYRKDAYIRAKNKIDSRIHNDSLGHANILIETMIGTAAKEEDVYIYSGKLPEESFRKSLNETTANKITIIVDSIEDISWIKNLNSTQFEKISIHKLKKSRPNHFFYTSGGAFRFELDANEFRAEANFNEPTAVAVLREAFERYLSDSEHIDLTNISA